MKFEQFCGSKQDRIERSGSADVNELPQPEEDARNHSETLIQFIRAEIDKQGGLIPFERYMDLALTAPGLGYYAAGAWKLGASGDFVTAPQLSGLFGQCMARQAERVFAQFKQPRDASILEFGAGSGQLCVDVLSQLKLENCLPLRYLILEVSPQLRQRQQALIQERIPDLSSRVEWLDRWPDPGFDGMVIANEVLDAFAVHRMAICKKSVYEWYVGYERQNFTWQMGEPSDARLIESLQPLTEDLSDDYQTEINLRALAWLSEVASIIRQGALFIIDYGYSEREYFHPQRRNGTLQCYYRHRRHSDPFLYPGLQDITAHLNFTALAETAMRCGLDVAAYATQASFLLANGLTQFLQQSESHGAAYLQLSQQAKTLTMPGEMGELFKVLVLTKHCEQSMGEYVYRDLRDRL